jgi:hypothetical protein
MTQTQIDLIPTATEIEERRRVRTRASLRSLLAIGDEHGLRKLKLPYSQPWLVEELEKAQWDVTVTDAELTITFPTRGKPQSACAYFACIFAGALLGVWVAWVMIGLQQGWFRK